MGALRAGEGRIPGELRVSLASIILRWRVALPAQKRGSSLTLALLLSRAIHVVSQVNVLVLVPLSLWILWSEDPRRTEDRAFGWSEDTGLVHAIACGYFLWDSWDAVWNFIDVGFVAHGKVSTPSKTNYEWRNR
jgi:hypothetical protein